MIRAIKNLYFAATAQPGRIDARSSTWYGWPMAYLASMIALLNSPYAVFALAPTTAAIFALLWSRKAYRAPTDFHKLIIASVGILIPTIGASFLGAPLFVVAALMCVGYTTLGKIIFENADRGVAEQQTELDQSDSLRRLRATPAAIFVEVGPPIGKLRNVDIPAWFRDDQGRTHAFIAACSGATLPLLEDGESLVYPGLIYRLSSNSAQTIAMKPEN